MLAALHLTRASLITAHSPLAQPVLSKGKASAVAAEWQEEVGFECARSRGLPLIEAYRKRQRENSHFRGGALITSRPLNLSPLQHASSSSPSSYQPIPSPSHLRPLSNGSFDQPSVVYTLLVLLFSCCCVWHPLHSRGALGGICFFSLDVMSISSCDWVWHTSPLLDDCVALLFL